MNRTYRSVNDCSFDISVPSTYKNKFDRFCRMRNKESKSSIEIKTKTQTKYHILFAT
jgi:hypothetical protein